MTPDAIAETYAGLARLYDEQIAHLRSGDPDLEALATLAEAVDRGLRALPPHDRLPAMDAATAERLAEAARATDARRAEAAALADRLRDAVGREAAAGERAASGARAYAGGGPAAAPPNFLDERR